MNELNRLYSMQFLTLLINFPSKIPYSLGTIPA